MKKKIDTNSDAAPLHANPFDALQQLNVENLPPGSSPLITSTTPTQAQPNKAIGRVVLRRETKDRGGKTVVVISELQSIPRYQTLAAKEELARELRKKLGCGGTVDGYEIVLQGDRPAEVCAILEKMNFRVVGVRS